MSYSPNFRGTSAKAARALLTGYQNGELFTLTYGQPVSVNGSGQLVHVDVTSDSSVAGILGVVAISGGIPSSANGSIMDNGRLENITTTFNVGDPVYINTDGNLMNARPDIGVVFGGQAAFAQGDYVVFVGVIVVNEFNALQKDLKLYMSVAGQL